MPISFGCSDVVESRKRAAVSLVIPFSSPFHCIFSNQYTRHPCRVFEARKAQETKSKPSARCNQFNRVQSIAKHRLKIIDQKVVERKSKGEPLAGRNTADGCIRGEMWRRLERNAGSRGGWIKGGLQGGAQRNEMGKQRMMALQLALSHP